MWLFGNKKAKEKIASDQFNNIQIQKIPDIFYGGQNPLIYQTTQKLIDGREVKTETVDNDKTNVDQKIFDKQERILPKKILWIMGVVVILGAIGISFYYLKDYFISPKKIDDTLAVKENEKTIEQIEEIETVTTTLEKTTTIEENILNEVATSTSSLESQPIVFPIFSEIDGSDIDADELTDAEEELFGIDSGNWDSDGDGYFDGQEISNLYNPKGFAPVKLIDSGLVKEYSNPIFGYSLYYPFDWEIGLVDKDYKQILFSALNGDYIEVRVTDKIKDKDFSGWFAQMAKGEKITDLQSFTNRFNVEGKKRKDNLVVYFETDNNVITITYHQIISGPILYRHILRVVYQSFRSAGNLNEVPNQLVLPIENAENNSPTVFDISSSTN